MAAIVQLGFGAALPLAGVGAVPPVFTGFTINEATDQSEWICAAVEAATITHVGFRYGSRTGTPPTFKESIQGVDGSGFPDGTIKGGGSPASATFTPPADATWDGTWRWIALDNAYTCTRGELLALVIAYDSGTIDASNASTFTMRVTSLAGDHAFPQAIYNSAGSRTPQVAGVPVFGYKSATQTYGIPIKGLNATSFDSETTPDEVGLAFTLPTGLSGTYQVGSVFTRFASLGVTGGSATLTLYDGTTVLQQITVDEDHQQAGTSVNERVAWWPFDEVSLSSLTVGSVYRVAWAPATAISDMSIRSITVENAQDLGAFQVGVQAYLTSRTNAGAWSDTLTERPLMEVRLVDMAAAGGDQMTAPAHATMVRQRRPAWHM